MSHVLHFKKKLSRRALLALASLGLLPGSAAFAEDIHWLDDYSRITDQWYVLDNWETFVVPGAGDTAINDVGSGIVVGEDWSLGGIKAGSAAGTSGAFTQTGGAVSSTGVLALGDGTGASGSWTLHAGSLAVGGLVTLGNAGGTGHFTQKGGTVGFGVDTGTNFYIGYDAGSNGTYTLDSGTLTAAGFLNRVGHNGGTGAIVQNGGTVSFTHGSAYLVLGGSGSGSNGSYTLDGADAQLNFTGYRIIVGEKAGNNTGTFNQKNGTFTSTGQLDLGQDAGATGTFNLSGGIIYASTREWKVGAGGGTGYFNQSDGVLNANNRFVVGGSGEGTKGTYTLTGGTLNSSGEFVIGNAAGKGTFTQEGGTFVKNGSYFYLGDHNTNGVVGEGTYNLKSGLLVVGDSADFRVGQSGAKGVFNVSGGTLAVGASGIILGYNSGASGKWTQTGGEVLVAGNVYIGGPHVVAEIGGTGQLQFSGGTFTAGQVQFSGSGSSLQLTGGTVTVQGFSKIAGAGAAITLDGGTLVAAASNADFFSGFATGDIVIGGTGVTLDTTNGAIAITTGLVGTGDITHTGAGFTLSGDNSGWSGALNITSGIVAIENDTVLKFVLDGASATTSSAGADAENVYAISGGSGLLAVGNVTLQVLLTNPDSLVGGAYIFNVFTGTIIPTGTVSLVTPSDANFSYEYIGNGQIRVTAIPESSAYGLISAAGLLGLVVSRRRRRN